MKIAGNTIASILVYVILFLPGSGIAWAQDNGETDKPLILEVGNFAAPRGSEQWIEREIQAFDDAHPDITVKSMAIVNPQRRREPIETIKRLPAHVLGIDVEAGYEAQYLAGQKVLVPIENFLPDDSFTLEDFPPSLIEAVKFRGQHWAVPWYASTELLLCNWPLFEDANLDHPPSTWEEFFEFAETLTKDTDDDGTIDQFGFKTTGYDDTSAFLVFTMILQQDGAIMKEGRYAPSIEATQRAIDTMRRLIVQPEFGQYDRASVIASLQNERYTSAMYFVHSKDVRFFSDNHNLRLAPLPTFSKRTAALFGGRFFAVRKSDAAHEAAAWKFVKWMTRKDVGTPAEWMGYPARSDFILREDFKEAASKGVQGLELLFTEPMNTVEIGDPAFHRFLGTYYLWQGILGIIRSPNGMASDSMSDAIAKANGAISPISTGANPFQRFR